MGGGEDSHLGVEPVRLSVQGEISVYLRVAMFRDGFTIAIMYALNALAHGYLVLRINHPPSASPSLT